MKVHGDIESINLATGERSRRVAGDGESVLRPINRGSVDVARLGTRPDVVYGPVEGGPTPEQIAEFANRILRGLHMHYRNGREAKNGDKIVKLEGGKVVAFGVLHSATPGNDYCNGQIAVVQSAQDYACFTSRTWPRC